MANSPRQKLLEFAQTGRLRDAAERHIDEETADLLVTIVMRYCERRSPRRKPMAKRQLNHMGVPISREDADRISKDGP